MLTENVNLMSNAWYSLSGRWKNPVLGTLLYMVISFFAGGVPYLGAIGAIVVTGPLLYGFTLLILEHIDTPQGGKIETLFTGFNNFLNAFVAYLLMTIFILLWALLLIIPGIMKAYSYSMTFFIMAETPNISGQDAITKSKILMQGNRWKLFCMDLRFLGWWILCILTLGVLSLWITPYYMTARALFYRDLLAHKGPEPTIPDTVHESMAGFYNNAPVSEQPASEPSTPHPEHQETSSQATPPRSQTSMETNFHAENVASSTPSSDAEPNHQADFQASIDTGLPDPAEPVNPYITGNEDHQA